MAFGFNTSSRLLRQAFASGMRRGFFMQSRASGIVPHVQPLPDRLQVARFKQVQLFHFALLNHGSSVGDAC
jgi:hypothetical protein